MLAVKYTTYAETAGVCCNCYERIEMGSKIIRDVRTDGHALHVKEYHMVCR